MNMDNTIFCERVLTGKLEEDRLILRLYTPEKDRKIDWKCRLDVLSVNGQLVYSKYSYGVDGLQALFCAIANLENILSEKAQGYQWLDGQFGYGIPTLLPEILDSEVRVRIDKCIEDYYGQQLKKIENNK